MSDILSSPPILFFILGLAGALARAQIRIPEALAKALAIYLLVAIGLKGGAAISREGLDLGLSLAAIAGILISGLLPLLAFYLLRAFTSLTTTEAAAVAAHYGSISIVTFITASAILDDTGIGYSGGMVGIAALMEAPAIITGLWQAARTQTGLPKIKTAELIRDVTFNESIFLLIGALLIGLSVNSKGQEALTPFFIDPMQGILCLFLLDMGLKAGEGLRADSRALKPGPILLGIGIPVINAIIALAISKVLGLGLGDTILFVTLAASASYIAVPAAMRLALPEINPSLYLTFSLGITFPFNVLVGISLYTWMAKLIIE